MPRQPRYFIPGIPQHVIQRGVDRQAVFFELDDFQLYRKALLTSAMQTRCAVHAYVLMTNHTHLLLTPGTSRSLPLLMQAMGRFYVQALNRKHDRTGPLWQGRYKASLVQDDRYLLTCHRYIELNPVRAKMVESPADYPFSSYGHNALGREDALLTPHPLYLSLASNHARRPAAYRQLFNDVIPTHELETIRTTTNACLLLGDSRFTKQIEAMLGRSVSPGKSGRPRKGG
ncbi:MAG: transposase [Woeseia sp.]